MGSSQGSTLTSAADVDVCLVDFLPVYVKELIAGGAAGAFSKTAVAPFERVKILMQVCRLLLHGFTYFLRCNGSLSTYIYLFLIINLFFFVSFRNFYVSFTFVEFKMILLC